MLYERRKLEHSTVVILLIYAALRKKLSAYWKSRKITVHSPADEQAQTTKYYHSWYRQIKTLLDKKPKGIQLSEAECDTDESFKYKYKKAKYLIHNAINSMLILFLNFRRKVKRWESPYKKVLQYLKWSCELMPNYKMVVNFWQLRGSYLKRT